MFRIRLKQLREEAGMSQYKFADVFGVAQSTVGSWESGAREPGFDTMQKLADFFDVSVDYLLGRTEDPARLSAKKETSPEISTEEALMVAFKGMLGRDPTQEELRRFLEMGKLFFNVSEEEPD